jgi:hypothetical protein
MSSTTQFVGPINNTRWKADLIDLVNALGIKENTGTIKELVHWIKTYLKEHQEPIASDPRFQKLFVYCTLAVQSTKAESKEMGRTVLIRRLKILQRKWRALLLRPGKWYNYLNPLRYWWQNHIYSANKKLLDLKVTTDPPPQFERLGSGKTEDKLLVRAGDSCSQPIHVRLLVPHYWLTPETWHNQWPDS